MQKLVGYMCFIIFLDIAANVSNKQSEEKH